MEQFKTIIILSLGVLFLIFVLQNTDVVSVRFLFWKISMSRIILLPIIFVLGLAGGLFLGYKYRP